MKRFSVGFVLGALLCASANVAAHAQDYAPPYGPAPDYGYPPAGEFQDFDCGGPCPQPCYEVSASLLFLQPGGVLEYGTLVSPLPAPSPHWNNQGVSPDFAPAFNIGLRYLIPECCNDVQLVWTHLESSDSASFVADPLQFAGPPYEVGPDANDYNIGRGWADFAYDTVNLDVGHLVDAGGFIQVRLFGGLQFARLGQDLSGMFSSFDGTLSTGYTNESLFTGVGPRLGMKAHALQGHFDFLGELGGSAMIGNMESRIGFATVDPELVDLGITPPNMQSLTSPDATRVIPSIDAKLGTGYTYPVNRSGVFRIEAGYQAAVYVNAVHKYSLTEVDTPSSTQSVGVFLRTSTPIEGDYTVHGPYLTASWLY